MKHSMNQRRRLLVVLGAGALTGGLAGELTGGRAAHAQGSAPPARIGFIVSTKATAIATRLAAFKQGMRENGLIEGTHYVLDAVYADGQFERFPALAQELLQRAPAVLMVSTIAAVRAVQKATSMVPVVMASSGDPVGSGFAKSLAKPGGNITGLSNLSAEVGTKMLEMLLEITATAKSKVSRVAVMINPANSGNVSLLQNIQATARITRSKILPLEVRNPSELATAFATLTRERSEVLIVARDSLFGQLDSEIAARALRLRLPTASGGSAAASAGLLMSIGPKRPDQFARVAMYIDRIFKGTKPDDLPIEQPTLFEVIINGKTAKALGLKIPQSLLISAERVIE